MGKHSFFNSKMHAIRKWVHKPRKNDSRLLAQFYYADEELLRVTQELDSFDGRTEPDRCALLIAELKLAQEKVIGLIEEIKNMIAPGCDESSREFRVKFPDEVLQDNLAGQLWFGAECLCAGSTIVNREQESIQLRPLAKQVVKSLSRLRASLREQALRNLNVYPSSIREAIMNFDEVFAQFEFEYVSILSRVRSVDDHDKLLDISVLFCETVDRAIEKSLLQQESIEDYDPGLMITIPRLAIIAGVLVFPDGPLDLSKGPDALPQMFKPFYKLLRKIRDLLFTLSEDELFILEKTLCSEENFDEVVLAADNLLNNTNYDRSYSKTKDKIYRDRRHGSIFPDLMPVLASNGSSTFESNLGFCETLRDITNKLSPNTDNCEPRGGVNAANLGEDQENGNSTNSRSELSETVTTLTTVAEVEVHNSFNDSQSASSSSNDSTPVATLQQATSQNTNNNNNSRKNSVANQSISNFTDLTLSTTLDVSVSLSTTTYNPSSLNHSRTHLPDDPPPPYSSGPENDGYSTSSEDDQPKRTSNRKYSKRNASSQSNTSNTLSDDAGSWPRRSTNRRQMLLSTLTSDMSDMATQNGHSPLSPDNGMFSASVNPYPREDTASSEQIVSGRNSHLSPEIQCAANNASSIEDAMQQMLLTAERESFDEKSAAKSSKENDKKKHEPSQDESGSSTSTLYLYKDSSSETESEGLIPQKFHLLRAKFKSTRDLIHTLFVCISGVADQLQSNYASDLRQTLKSVFLTMASNGEKSLDELKNDMTKGWLTSKHFITYKSHEEPPPWTDDSECTCCSACSTCFNFFKRRHHCRLCGKIFCSSCASNFVPLPRYGLLSPVRVCTSCIESAIDRLV